MTTTVEPLAYTVGQTAEALQVSTWMVYKLIRDGRLTRVPYCGQRVRIARAELERFVNERGTK